MEPFYRGNFITMKPTLVGGWVSGGAGQVLLGSKGLYSVSHRLSFLVMGMSKPGQSPPASKVYTYSHTQIATTVYSHCLYLKNHQKYPSFLKHQD